MIQESHSWAYIWTKLLIQKGTHIAMSIAVLFTISKTWKQSKCPLTDEWVKKMWHMLYNGILSHKE